MKTEEISQVTPGFKFDVSMQNNKEIETSCEVKAEQLEIEEIKYKKSNVQENKKKVLYAVFVVMGLNEIPT